MYAVSVFCFLACSGPLCNWCDAFPIGAMYHDLRGAVPPEPNVVMQSVVVGKKPGIDIDDSTNCPGYNYNNMEYIMRRLFQTFQPNAYRFKREDKDIDEDQSSAEKYVDRLIEAISELKNEENIQNHRSEDLREGEEDSKKSRSESKRRKENSWSRSREEEDRRRWKKKHGLSSSKKEEEEYRQEKNEERGDKGVKNKRKDWREEELDGSHTLRERLEDSWPRRMATQDVPFPLYLPLYNHHPNHQRIAGGYIA